MPPKESRSKQKERREREAYEKLKGITSQPEYKGPQYGIRRGVDLNEILERSER